MDFVKFYCSAIAILNHKMSLTLEAALIVLTQTYIVSALLSWHVCPRIVTLG
jgi:hypothetical protein